MTDRVWINITVQYPAGCLVEEWVGAPRAEWDAMTGHEQADYLAKLVAPFSARVTGAPRFVVTPAGVS